MRLLKSKTDIASNQAHRLCLFIGGMLIGFYTLYIAFTLLSP